MGVYYFYKLFTVLVILNLLLGILVMKRILQVRYNWILRHLIAFVVFVGSFAVGASVQAADPLILTYQG